MFPYNCSLSIQIQEFWRDISVKWFSIFSNCWKNSVWIGGKGHILLFMFTLCCHTKLRPGQAKQRPARQSVDSKANTIISLKCRSFLSLEYKNQQILFIIQFLIMFSRIFRKKENFFFFLLLFQYKKSAGGLPPSSLFYYISNITKKCLKKSIKLKLQVIYLIKDVYEGFPQWVEFPSSWRWRWMYVCVCVLSLEWIEKRLSLYSGSTPRNSEINKTISWDSRDESPSNNKDIKS